MSKNDDLVRRLRNGQPDDRQRQREARIELSHLLNEAADAIERSAAQGVVTDAMVSAALNQLGFGSADSVRMRAALEAAFTHTPPAPAPDAGEEWKLVPVEPTDGMIEAGEEECSERASYGMGVYAADIYTAMLAAVPSPTPQPPAVEAGATPGERVIEAAKEAVAVAKGEAAAIWHVMDSKTVAAYGPWVRFTDHEAILKAKTDEIERLREELHRANGIADLSIKHRDTTEASNKALREKVRRYLPKAVHGYAECDRVCLCGLDDIRALLSETGGE